MEGQHSLRFFACCSVRFSWLLESDAINTHTKCSLILLSTDFIHNGNHWCDMHMSTFVFLACINHCSLAMKGYTLGQCWPYRQHSGLRTPADGVICETCSLNGLTGESSQNPCTYQMLALPSWSLLCLSNPHVLTFFHFLIWIPDCFPSVLTHQVRILTAIHFSIFISCTISCWKNLAPRGKPTKPTNNALL